MSHSTNEEDQPFYVRRKPDPVPFSKFLYNSEKGTVMGRTGSSWGKAAMLITRCISGATIIGEELLTHTPSRSPLDYTGVEWCCCLSMSTSPHLHRASAASCFTNSARTNTPNQSALLENLIKRTDKGGSLIVARISMSCVA